MKIEVEKKALSDAFAVAARAVNVRSPLVVLHSLLLESADDRLTVTGNNLDASYQVEIPCVTIEPGATTFRAKLGIDIISKLPAVPIILESAEDKLFVRYGRSGVFEVPALPPDDFPRPEKHDYPSAIPAQILGSLIKSVVFATADSNESRAVMTGIWMRANAGQLEMATTDGRRLCYVSTQAVMPDLKIVAPGREMAQLAKLVAKMHPEDTVPCYINGNNASFQCNHITFNLRLIEGVFPDVHRVRPNPNFIQRTARIGKDSLANAISRLLVVAQEKQSPSLLVFNFGLDKLEILASTPDVGTGSEEVAIVLDGDPIKIAFNGKYLLEFVQTVSTEEVLIKLQDDTRSAVISPYPPLDDINLEYVIMPVRIREVVEDGG